MSDRSTVTLADVARRAGVSVQTASRVANNRGETSAETRAHVLRVIAELGYRPNVVARSLRARSTRSIGILVPDIANPFFPALFRGAEDAASEAGYAIFLGDVVEDIAREAAMLSVMEDRRVDGIIVCSARQGDAELFASLRRHRSAVVINRTTPPDLAGVVRVDYRQAAEKAVAHLAEVGCRTLAYVGGPAQSRGGAERAEGFETALRRLRLHVIDDHAVPARPTIEGGYQATRLLLRRSPNIDGLFCYNDLVAAGSMAACKQAGRRVPDDIAVIGSDDISFAALFCPSLTTLRVPTYDMGRVAVRLLLERMNGVTNQPSMLFPTELVVRESTRRLAPQRSSSARTGQQKASEVSASG
jgi:LacI family transcriptional regulator